MGTAASCRGTGDVRRGPSGVARAGAAGSADLERIAFIKKKFPDAIRQFNAVIEYNSFYPGGDDAAHTAVDEMLATAARVLTPIVSVNRPCGMLASTCGVRAVSSPARHT